MSFYACKPNSLRCGSKPGRVKGSKSLTSLLEVVLLLDDALQIQQHTPGSQNQEKNPTMTHLRHYIVQRCSHKPTIA